MGGKDIGIADADCGNRLLFSCPEPPSDVRRVLVVDDHPLMRAAMRRVLLEYSPELRVAGEAVNGREGVARALAGDWDMVLMDISMPVMGGVAALQEIKAAKPYLPVVMVSTHPARQMAARLCQLGADGYVEKSDAPEDWIRAIRNALEE